MKKLNIKNNAQFLFEFRYPSETMIRMNRSLIGALKNAGFDFF